MTKPSGMLAAAARKRASLARSAASARIRSAHVALGGHEIHRRPVSSMTGEIVASWWIRPPALWRLTIRPCQTRPARRAVDLGVELGWMLVAAHQLARRATERLLGACSR